MIMTVMFLFKSKNEVINTNLFSQFLTVCQCGLLPLIYSNLPKWPHHYTALTHTLMSHFFKNLINRHCFLFSDSKQHITNIYCTSPYTQCETSAFTRSVSQALIPDPAFRNRYGQKFGIAVLITTEYHKDLLYPSERLRDYTFSTGRPALIECCMHCLCNVCNVDCYPSYLCLAHVTVLCTVSDFVFVMTVFCFVFFKQKPCVNQFVKLSQARLNCN